MKKESRGIDLKKTWTALSLTLCIALAASGAAVAAPKAESYDFYDTLRSINKRSMVYTVEDKPNLIFSPKIQQSQRKAYRKAIERSLAFWTKDVDLGEVNIFLWNPNDLRWAKSEYSRFFASWGYKADVLDADVVFYGGRNHCTGANLGSERFKRGTNEPTLVHNIRICVPGPRDESPSYWHVISHELTHVWQFSVMNLTQQKAPPLWLLEGMGYFYGMSLTGINQKNAVADIREHYNYFPIGNSGSKALVERLRTNKISLEKILDTTASENAGFDSASTGNSYFFGSLVISHIVSKYGHDKFVEYYESFKQGTNYKENFLRIFGEDFGPFARSITPAVLKELGVSSRKR